MMLPFHRGSVRRRSSPSCSQAATRSTDHPFCRHPTWGMECASRSMTSPTMPLRTEGLLLSIDKEHYRVRYLFAWVLSLAFRVTAECGTLQEAILNIGSHLPIACPRDA